MIRIAFIHGSFPTGGAERITIDIARYLSGVSGYEVYVLATRISEHLLTSEILNVVKLRPIPSQGMPGHRAKAIERIVIGENIDILVQVSKSVPGIEGIIQRTGCKTIVACHGEPFWQRYIITYRRQKGILRRIMWHLFNKRRFADGTLAMKMAKERTLHDYMSCDAYTVLCDSYKKETEDALGLDPSDSHIFVVENPERPVPDVNFNKEKILLFCGRFENWSKRIDRLLRIWGMVQDRLPDWRLVLLGDGPAGGMLRKLAVELGLERVSFEGMRNDVHDYYRKASVVCLVSETEGWPLALTEAQAQGCIGIGFGCTSGIKEILGPDGKCGFIVPPYDENAYAETVLKVASLSREKELEIRMRSVEKRLAYAPDIIAEKWRVLFDTLMQKK